MSSDDHENHELLRENWVKQIKILDNKGYEVNGGDVVLGGIGVARTLLECHRG